jgi:hypothetical protein
MAEKRSHSFLQSIVIRWSRWIAIGAPPQTRALPVSRDSIYDE